MMNVVVGRHTKYMGCGWLWHHPADLQVVVSSLVANAYMAV